MREHSERWWLHLDLDVLSTAALAAVDYPQNGGLSWQARRVFETALAEPGCARLSVVIYNPDLDPDRSAARAIVGFLAEVLDQLAGPDPSISSRASFIGRPPP